MLATSIRAVVAALFAVSFLGTSFTADAETWRMAHKQPPTSPEGIAHQKFADKVAELSKGQLTVKVFHSSQLGESHPVLEQLKAGTIQVYTEAVSTLHKWVPNMKYLDAPFLFSDGGHYQRFMRSDYVKGLMKELTDDVGVLVLGDGTEFLRGPYRVTVSKKPMRSLADVKNLKLRIHNDPLVAKAWQHLGAEVKTLGWGDVYVSLSRGLVEAVNSPIALVESMRFHEAAPNIIRQNEFWQTLAYIVNRKAYETLKPDLQAAVLNAYKEAASYATNTMEGFAAESIERMKSKGATYAEVDTKDFVARMQILYDQQIASGEMPKALMEAVERTRASK